MINYKYDKYEDFVIPITKPFDFLLVNLKGPVPSFTCTIIALW